MKKILYFIYITLQFAKPWLAKFVHAEQNSSITVFSLFLSPARKLSLHTACLQFVVSQVFVCLSDRSSVDKGKVSYLPRPGEHQSLWTASRSASEDVDGSWATCTELDTSPLSARRWWSVTHLCLPYWRSLRWWWPRCWGLGSHRPKFWSVSLDLTRSRRGVRMYSKTKIDDVFYSLH